MKAPSLNFYCIKQKNDAKNFRIILSITWDGKRVIYYPGIVLKNYQWDFDKREFQNIENKDALNEGLLSLKKQIIDLHRSLSIRYGNVTERHLKLELSRIKIRPGYSPGGGFVKFIEANESSWSRNTFMRCQSFYAKLNRFVELYNPSASLETVDKGFLQAFDNYLLREGLNPGSRYSYMNLFKWFLSWALRKNLLINDDFKNFKLTSIHQIAMVKHPPLYLNWEELMTLYHSNPENKKLEHCRDIYCFMAFTGCQLNELQSLLKTDIEGSCLLIRGKNERRISLNAYSKEIIDKYLNKYYRRGDLFPYYTKVTLNKNIRELSVFLNFERKVKIQRRGKIMQSSVDKLITINSAKMTFYANAVKMGLSPGVIQLWTGSESLGPYKRVKNDIIEQEKENLEIIDKYYENSL